MDNPFKGHRFNREIILLCVRWHCKTSLSYQQFSEMLAERGVSVDESNVWRWVQKFAPEIKKRAYGIILMRPRLKLKDNLNICIVQLIAEVILLIFC
jgi:hypothetical protein